MQAVVIFSGGMDSGIALAKAVEEYSAAEVHALSFDYGAKHNARELRFAKLVAKMYGVKHHVLKLPFVNKLFASDLLLSGDRVPEGHYTHPSMKQTVVPFRNGIMVAIAAGYAESVGASEIILGVHKGDHPIYRDCTAQFIDAMDYAVTRGLDTQINVRAPFARYNKAQIARIGASIGYPFEFSWSCYKGEEKHCGRCGTCVERKEAFDNAGLPDPTEYTDPVYSCFPEADEADAATDPFADEETDA